MAYLNPNNIEYYFARETTAGTIPTAPAWKKLDHTPGDMIDSISESITSPVVVSGRAAASTDNVAFGNAGTINTHMMRTAAFDMALESVLSGAFASGELKGSNSDFSHSIEKRIKSGAGFVYERFLGAQVPSLKISTDAKGAVIAAIEWMGIRSNTATTAVASSTYSLSDSSIRLLGKHVTNFTVTGMTGIQCRAFDLSIEQPREALDVFGSPYAFAIATGENRAIKLNATFYRQDNTAQTMFWETDTKVAVSFDIGSGDDGYRVTLPKCSVKVVGGVDGAKFTDQLEFTPERDDTAGTDVIFTKLEA